jgi:hypothetical protein
MQGTHPIMNEADDFDAIVIKSMALTKEELDDIKRQLQNQLDRKRGTRRPDQVVDQSLPRVPI